VQILRAHGSEPCYFLRRADGQGYVLTDDGETFTAVPQRHLASAFCSHHAPAIAQMLHEQTGVRHRMIFAGYLCADHSCGPVTTGIPSPDLAMLDRDCRLVN
jgi:hypothetical protein